MKVLVTGAAGDIGRSLRTGLAGRYELLRLLDRQTMEPARAGEELCVADITDVAAVGQAMEGIDVVVHLAGIPTEAEWGPLLDSNVFGTVNIFEQARRAGVSRVVFASSNHVVGYYRVERAISANVPVRPDTRYGVTKAFGEALGRYSADKFGLSVICLRIGSFRESVTAPRELMTWLSPDDMVRLAAASIEAADIHFEIVYGVSANTRRMWHDDGAARIGYSPRDDAELFAAQALDIRPADVPPMSPVDDGEKGSLRPAVQDSDFHGGSYAALERGSDPSKID